MAESMPIRFNLNGSEVTVAVEPGRSLLYVLREVLDLTGTKQACDCEGECGACTVLLDGEAVRSCLTPIERVAGRRVLTIEGLGTPGNLHPLQQAFIDEGAVQCGYCTPGMILSAAALLDRTPNPSREQIVEALAGNLCRCTGYLRIIRAVEVAARVMGEAPPQFPPHGGGEAGELLTGPILAKPPPQSPLHGGGEAGELLTGPILARASSQFPPYGGGEAKRRVIGGSEIRVDAVEKVTGAARYAEDIKMQGPDGSGLLHAALVRSPYPHARILAIDPTPALALPGVLRVLTARDIPGANTLEGYSRDEPLLKPVGGSVRMIADAIAIVVGELEKIAHEGAAAVRVEYELLPAVYDVVEAMQDGAVPLYPQGNVLSTHEILYGDMEAAMSAADVTVESHYETPYLEHSALERETVLGYVDDEGRVTVIGGSQEPHWARDWSARLLALPPERVRVIVPAMGGAFGGRQDPWPIMAGALAAYHSPGGRPVRLTYSRRESFDASPKRHPYRLDYRIGARNDGTLTGLHLRVVANTGAYDADGWYIPQYALVAGGGPYRWQAADARACSVYTNGPKSGQMRGFGTPQSIFALECTLDELAERLGIDPLELRWKNAIDDETVTFLGYPPAETIGYRECLEAIRPHYRHALTLATGVNRQRDGDPWRRGVGLAGMWYRFGKPGTISSQADAELNLDGTITCYCSAPDYGQGTATVMAQLAAEALGLPRDHLRIVNADTARTPDSGIQGASRSTYWVGGAVAQAATALKRQILNTAAEMVDLHPGRLVLTAEAVVTAEGAAVSLAAVAAEMERIGLPRRVRGVFAPQLGPDLSERARPAFLPFFVTGAHLAEVDVNVETGQVQVLRIVAAHDVGHAVNLQGVQGQVEGAVLMSLGAALMEEYIPGVSTGFSDYYLPTIRCTPQIEVIPVEVPSRWGPQGAKGLGEAATLATTPAVLNAIHHATGARLRRIPATPECVLAAVREVGTSSP
jgi:CO/xanthine dehydrogenase Mo-binding subunit/aerobic-type carbon monoxide dehydrogenase small subunit (CoxS/CutS family)